MSFDCDFNFKKQAVHISFCMWEHIPSMRSANIPVFFDKDCKTVNVEQDCLPLAAKS